eukprot:GHVH01001129.1.p1 GENE.GHVH01001129.1~~GHVH01001129.1.p1  ORF type:complete len:1071 (+),score=181.01 GHVH01001129.1:50-3262(+)
MVQTAFVNFYKFENVMSRKERHAAEFKEIPVTDSVTGTGRRPILPPSIQSEMPVFQTDCGRTLESINADTTLTKEESKKLIQVLKNRERQWVGKMRADQIPKDRRQDERNALMTEFQTSLRSIPTVDDGAPSSQILKVLEKQVTQAKKLQRDIEEGVAKLEALSDHRVKVAKITDQLKQIHLLLDTLAIHNGAEAPSDAAELSISKEECEEALAEAARLYELTLGRTNQREFVASCEEITDRLKSEFLRPATRNKNSVMERAKVERFHERYINLLGEDAAPAPVSRSVEVSSTLMDLLFPPRTLGGIAPAKPQSAWSMPLFPRVEQIYKVVIAPNRQQSITSSLNVLGEKNACVQFTRFIESGPLVRRVPVEKDEIASVIGPGGANKRRIEEQIRAPVSIVDNVAHILGSPEHVSAYKSAVKEIVKEVQETNKNNASTIRVPITRVQARFLNSRNSGGALLQQIVRPLKVTTRVLNWRSEETDESILLLQGPGSGTEKAKKEIIEFIDTLSFVTLSGPARASRKLLSGLNALKALDRLNKQLENTRDLTEMRSATRGPVDEFGEIVRQHKLCAFMFDEAQAAPGIAFFKDVVEAEPIIHAENELEDDEHSTLVVVGEPDVLQYLLEPIALCFEQASYLQELIEMNIGQAQVINLDQLQEAVKDLPVSVRFAGRDIPNNKQRVAVVGAIASRIEAIALIEQMLLEDAVEDQMEVKSEEMILLLKDNMHALLNYYQDQHSVHLGLPRDANNLKVTIVGRRGDIEACKEVISKKDDEVFVRLQDCEVRQVVVPQSAIRRVIGSGGANLRHIQSVSGARISQRRDLAMPDGSSDVVVFDVKGDTASVELAIGMIEGTVTTPESSKGQNATEKISQYEKLPFTPASLSGGNTRTRGMGRGKSVGQTQQQPKLLAKNFDDDFPDLAELSVPARSPVNNSATVAQKVQNPVVNEEIIQPVVYERIDEPPPEIPAIDADIEQHLAAIDNSDKELPSEEVLNEEEAVESREEAVESREEAVESREEAVESSEEAVESSADNVDPVGELQQATAVESSADNVDPVGELQQATAVADEISQ